MNEREKKRAYNERVLQIDSVILAPLFFSIYGSMEGECSTFYSRLSDLSDLPKSITMNWIRAKICFALFKLSLLCLTGSRTVCKYVVEFESNAVVSEDMRNGLCELI